MIKVEGYAVACWYMFNSWLGGRARGQKTYDLWILPICLKTLIMANFKLPSWITECRIGKRCM